MSDQMSLLLRQLEVPGGFVQLDSQGTGGGKGNDMLRFPECGV